MAIETKFIDGDGGLGSKLQMTITPPDLGNKPMGEVLLSRNPLAVCGLEGLYVFPLDTQEWDIVPETGDAKGVTLTGIRIE